MRIGNLIFPLIISAMMSGGTGPLFSLTDLAIRKYGIPGYSVRHGKFKGWMRERFLGRRRSKFYFNKNR